ncbi:MAG: bifunctional chorismate mutase/prephenate dehydrogenase [Pseudomonadota bacterium]|nr:bifunctional chorismate mutase/prephenate dehydrogenase [Pseudomonadota bacterium]
MNTPDIEHELDQLRQKIDDIDDRFVSLLAERRELVEEVIQLKKKYRLPVYHPAREENLISQRRKQGSCEGLDPDFIEELYRLILRHSRVSQSQQLSRKAIKPGAAILLVGGSGEMGRYFHRWFNAAGYRVRILDQDDWTQVASLCQEIDLALVGVPIEATAEVIRNLGPYLPEEAILADITSIKELPLQAMLKAHRGPVIGLHPLFGPDTSTMDKQIVVKTPGRMPEQCQWLMDQLNAWGAITVTTDAHEHDEVMAYVQALRHFATFGFGRFLYQQKADIFKSLEFSSPIYRLELGMVGRLFAQDPKLYAEIIFATPERQELLKSYLASMVEQLEMLNTADKEEFCREFSRISAWFGPFGDQAMRESSYLIDKLIERF